MANVNQCNLIGNLTRDPELRVTPQGTAICQFGLAINRKFKDGQGAEREEVTYVDCEAWGKSGENIAKYCAKGRPLYVSGRLKLDQWTDKTTNEKRSKMKVVVENFQFLGDGRPQQSAAQTEAPKSTGASLAHHSPGGLDEDVPFAPFKEI